MKGTITKRPGTHGIAYRVRVDLPPDPLTGERRRQTGTFRTRKEAESQMAQWIADIERGTAIDVTKLTVGEYLTQWLASLGESVRPQTQRRYADLLGQHTIPTLGHVALPKLAAPHVRALYADLLAAGLSNMTVRLVHMVLHRALKQAVHDGLLGRNVTEAVRAPRKTVPEYTAWTAEQAARFLATADQDAERALWRLAILTGLRRGELLGIKWDDLDFTRGTLAVRRSRSRSASGNWETGAPKTTSGRRSVALPRSVVDALRLHRTRQGEYRLRLGSAYRDEGWVFAGALGGPLHVNSLVCRFERLMTRAAVPRLRFHDLRHTAATLMLANGEHPKKVQAQLGHANIAITLDRYSHVTEGMQHEAADRLDVLLEQASAAAR
jgi:integrase